MIWDGGFEANSLDGWGFNWQVQRVWGVETTLDPDLQRAAVDAMHASAAHYEQTVLEAFAQVADLLEALDHDAEQLDAQA